MDVSGIVAELEKIQRELSAAGLRLQSSKGEGYAREFAGMAAEVESVQWKLKETWESLRTRAPELCAAVSGVG